MGEQATSQLRRDACSPAKAPGRGFLGGARASLGFSLRRAPLPYPGPNLHKSRRERLRTRLCSHSGGSHPLGGESTGSWPRLTSSPKRTGGKGREPRARAKDEEARADGARVSRDQDQDQDHDPRLGLKHFRSQTLERQGKLGFPGPRLPGAPAGGLDRGEESVALLVT